jgi:hypothetical protein
MARSKHTKSNPVESPKTALYLNKEPLSGYYPLHPVFCFARFDPEAPCEHSEEISASVSKVLSHLKNRELSTWGDIIGQSGGRRQGTNNHYVSISELPRRVQKRADAIRLEESELFSMRLEGEVRLWGIISSSGKFYVIWYDPEHEIYPVSKRHT